MNRRRFLALIGIGTPGIWIDRSGLIQFSKHIVIAIAGQCSFCGKLAREVLCLAGVIGRPARVCNECIDHGLEVLKPNLPRATPPPSPTEISIDNEGAVAFDFRLPEGLLNVSLPHTEAELEAVIGQPLPHTEAELEAFLDQWRNLINQARTDQGQIKHSQLSCSFCDRTRSEVGNLLASPQTYICDYCIREAAESMKTLR